MTHYACATLSASAVFGLGLASHATDLPPYVEVMAGASWPHAINSWLILIATISFARRYGELHG